MLNHLYNPQTFTKRTRYEYVCDRCNQVIPKGSSCVREIKRRNKGFTNTGIYHPECCPLKNKMRAYDGKIETINGRWIDKNNFSHQEIKK